MYYLVSDGFTEEVPEVTYLGIKDSIFGAEVKIEDRFYFYPESEEALSVGVLCLD